MVGRRSTCSRHALVALLLAGVLAAVAGAEKEEHHYAKGDEVPLIANKIGPYANPS